MLKCKNSRILEKVLNFKEYLNLKYVRFYFRFELPTSIVEVQSEEQLQMQVVNEGAATVKEEASEQMEESEDSSMRPATSESNQNTSSALGSEMDEGDVTKPRSVCHETRQPESEFLIINSKKWLEIL